MFLQASKKTLAIFPVDHYAKHRKLLQPKRVRELSELRPHIVIRDTLLTWGVILACRGLVSMNPFWWVVALVIPFIGSSYYALSVIGHDGIHWRSFENRKLNNFFNDLFIFGPIGVITVINGKNHMLHHKHMGTENDPDRFKYSCQNKFDVEGLLSYLTGYERLISALRDVYHIRINKSDSKPKTKLMYTSKDIILLLSWQVLLISTLSYFVGWWGYPLLWILPVALFAYLPDNFRTFAEHSHPEPDSIADAHRLISFTPNYLERTFLAPNNMNYHAEHHLWPSIPYYNLHIAHAEIKNLPEAKDLVSRNSYLGYLREYMTQLPIVDCFGKDS